MLWEIIGSVDTGEYPRDASWIEFAQQFAIQYIEFICGPPPEGCTLEITYLDHDLGSYPSMGVARDELRTIDFPWDYIRQCEEVLIELNAAIDWRRLKPEQFSYLFENDEEEDSY